MKIFHLVLGAALAITVEANSPPGKVSYINHLPYYEERLRIYFPRASNANIHIITAYHATEGYINSTITTSTSSTIYVYIETGNCGRNYNVTVFGVNGFGYGQALWRTCATELEIPRISNVEKKGLNATIRWTNHCDTRHDLLLVDQNNPETAQRFNDTQSPQTFAMAPNMLYCAEVIAVYEIGERRSSKTYFTSGWPGPITYRSYTNTLHSIHLRWQEAEYADSYHIQVTSYGDNTVVAKLDTKDNEFRLLNNVKAGRRFNFEIRGINSLGQGPSYSSYMYSAKGSPLIQSASILPDGTGKIRWSAAENNENYSLQVYILGVSTIHSSVVNGVTYNSNLTITTSCLYAYVHTRDYHSNAGSSYFYFSSDALRPVINAVSQTSYRQLLIEASTSKAFTSYRIRVDSYSNNDGIPKHYGRETSGNREPFLANIYLNSGKLYTHYVTIIFDDTRCTDTFIYKTEPPQVIPTLTQTHSRTDAIRVTWTRGGFVERFQILATLLDISSAKVNTSTTGNEYWLRHLKAGHYYNVTVTPENPAGQGPSSTLLVKTEMTLPSVTRVIQQPGYLARIEWSPARDALRHVMVINNNGTNGVVNTTEGIPVLYPLNGSLELNIRIVAVYDVGNTSSTYTFQGKCENSKCGSNSSCQLDVKNIQICSCQKYFKGDATVACYPFCLTQQLNGYTFLGQSPVGKLVYSVDTCPSGRPNASAICEIRKRGEKYFPQFSTLNEADCDLQISNVTYEAIALTSSKLELLCEQFQILTADVSLIEDNDVIELIKFYAMFNRSDITISSNGVRACLATASQLTEYFRSHHNKTHEKSLLKAIPKMLRHLETPRSNILSEYAWTSVNLFGKVIDVPVPVAQDIENETLTISPVFISRDGTGKPVHSIEFIVPFALISSVHNSLAESAECVLRTVRIVFLTFRDSTLFPAKHESDWILFAEIGSEKQVITSNYSQALTFKQLGVAQFSAVNLHCGRLDLENFYWTNEGCISKAETKACACDQTGYYGIFQEEVFGPKISYRVQYQDIAGCTAAIVAYIYTIVSIATKRSVQNHKLQAFVQMLGAFCACHLVFITGVDQTDSFVSCSVVAFLLHYFLLCSWTWTSIYVYAMYRDYVQKKNEFEHKLAKIRTAAAYCIPLVIGAVAGGAVWPQTSSYGDAPGSRSQMGFCFVESYALYFGLILPVGLLTSWMLYACISLWKNIGQNGGYRAEISSSFTFVFIILISWIAAVSAIFTSNVIPSWIFFSLNVLQAIRLAFGTCYTMNEVPPAQSLQADVVGTNNEAAEEPKYETSCAGMAAEDPVENPYEDVRMYENMSPGS